MNRQQSDATLAQVLEVIASATRLALAVLPQPEPTTALGQCEACTAIQERNQLLEQLTAEIMGHFSTPGSLLGANTLMCQVDRTVIARWRKTLTSTQSG